MSSKAVLRGVAWNHSRALPPLVATAQRFEELNPGVEIHWEKHSLHEFGHADLGPLAARYQLLIVDHPMMGAAYESHALLDLQPLLDPSYLRDLELDSVGRSFESYRYQGSLFAVPIDVAAPAASYRPDLLKSYDIEPPHDWDDVIKLARRKLVVMPGFHADVFLNFMGLCASHGAEISIDQEEIVERNTACECLDELRELASHMPDVIYEWNPIAVYENMTTEDRYAYCPFAYSYSNYSRAGFARMPIRFANPVMLTETRVPVRTVLGGTGMAVSSKCETVEIALKYLMQATGSEWQRTLYGLSGGQPARQSAWHDETLNQITDGFFRQTLYSVENAYTRPRYPGYTEFQAEAGAPIAEYLRDGGNKARTLEKINALYRQSRKERLR